MDSSGRTPPTEREGGNRASRERRMLHTTPDGRACSSSSLLSKTPGVGWLVCLRHFCPDQTVLSAPRITYPPPLVQSTQTVGSANELFRAFWLALLKGTISTNNTGFSHVHSCVSFSGHLAPGETRPRASVRRPLHTHLRGGQAAAGAAARGGLQDRTG